MICFSVWNVFFFKKCQKQKLFRVARLGYHTAHFLCLKIVRATGLNSGMNQYKDNRVATRVQATVSDFWSTETDFQVFCSPFTVNPSDRPVDLRLELDLQYGSDMKTKFALRAWTHSISIFFQVTSRWHPLLQKFCAYLGRHIFVNKCSLWWTSIKQLRSRLTLMQGRI